MRCLRSELDLTAREAAPKSGENVFIRLPTVNIFRVSPTVRIERDFKPAVNARHAI
jgi:hypothetical protein